MNFAALADHWVKLKGSKKKISTKTLLDIRKKVWKTKGEVISIVISTFGTVTKGFIKGSEELGNKRTSNYSIVEIGQNTKKSPGDLRRLAVTKTPAKDHQLMLV